MVREKRARRPQPKPESGSIWDTPHLKQIISQPFGAPIELTQEEARAIVRDMLEHPRPYDAARAEKDHRELRRIRRMWGSLARDLDD